MPMSDWLQEHKNALTTLVLVCCALGTVIALRGRGMAAEYRMDYFYDLQTGKLFTAERSELAPIDAPSGAGNGIKAAVFSCGACQDKQQHFIAWVERYMPEAKEAMLAERASQTETVNPQFNAIIGNGHQIAFLDDDTGKELRWRPSSSPQAISRIRNVLSRCTGGKAAIACNPLPEDIH